MVINTHTLTNEFLSRLRGFVRKRVRVQQDAEDVVQEVLSKLVQHAPSIDDEAVHAWLFTVARRAIIDRGRAARKAGQLPDELPIADEFAADSTVITDLARCMEPMLATLDADERALLQQVDMAGQSQADIARELGMSMSGLKSRVQRARKKLRSVLEQCCSVELDRRGSPVEYERRLDDGCSCGDCGCR